MTRRLSQTTRARSRFLRAGCVVAIGRVVASVCVVASVVVLLAGCYAGPPDRRAQADRLTQQIRTMPGVVTASSDVVNSFAQGMVHFWLDVEVTDDITADQLAAITSRYLDDLRAADYAGYQTELDVHRDWNLFAVDSGERAVTNAGQIVVQARSWVQLRHEFPGATIRFRATVTRAGGAVAGSDSGHPDAGTIELPDTADYTAVVTAVSRLGSRFPELSSGSWMISAGKAHPAGITTARRLPNAAELDVFNTLNADQSVPHVDAMTINGPTTGPVWISEKTLSPDISVAVQLARSHLPIVATLPAPVLYTTNDHLQGRLDYSGAAAGPVAITLGRCMRRIYRPDAAEQALIDIYETCRR